MNSALEYSDCSDIIPDIDKIKMMNRYIRKNKFQELKFQFSQLGPGHQPIFKATLNFQGYDFSANGHNKKECERKIKTCIWILLSEKILEIQEKPKTVIKKLDKIVPIFHSFYNFKEILNQKLNPSRSILLIDIENIGPKILNSQKFNTICSLYDIKVICVCSRLIPTSQQDMLLIRRDFLHKGSTQEAIRRLIYYMFDHLGCKHVGLMTMCHFAEAIKHVLSETNQKLVIFRDIDEFTSKYFRILMKKEDNDGKNAQIETETIIIIESDKEN